VIVLTLVGALYTVVFPTSGYTGSPTAVKVFCTGGGGAVVCTGGSEKTEPLLGL